MAATMQFPGRLCPSTVEAETSGGIDGMNSLARRSFLTTCQSRPILQLLLAILRKAY